LIMTPIEIAGRFSSTVKNLEPLGNGHINDTYLVTEAENRFVLQKINRDVFPCPELIMANLDVLSRFVEQASDSRIDLIIPQLRPSEKGEYFFCDHQGDYWRALSFIENTESLETISNLAQVQQVGFALGQFHRLTRTLESEKLHDTLPGFHICPSYLNRYNQVKKTSNIPEEPYCSEFIARYQAIVDDLEEAKEKGLLSIRVIHGDPKLNNFLFDKDSQRIVSIIDLDTVKPGLVHYDIGDCIRSCCHSIETNEFNLEICQVLIRSYLKEMRTFFSGYDYQFLYPAIRLIPFELGLRFYTDYLEGNRYFKVAEPEENLHRAKSQFHLCNSIIVQEKNIKNVINLMVI
jgi:Ser/Thr protein kinase RdoA (MazF antagonist)